MASYSCNDNQNYFVGSGRTTSRVLAQPGGKTSISIGIDDSADEKNKVQTHSQRIKNKPEVTGKIGAKVESSTSEKVEEMNTEPEVEEKVTTGTLAEIGAATEKKAVARPSQYSCNDNQNYFVESGRTSSRVLAPPGGKSSIVLG